MTPVSTRQVREAVHWLRRRVRGKLCTDSRRIAPGDGFVAWPGARADGRAFVAQALARGAAACLVEQHGLERFPLPPAAGEVLPFPGLKAACGPIADLYYGHPSAAMHLVAITGTNGKTSCSWWLAAALGRLQHGGLSPCALVGTLGMGLPPALENNGLTTPDPVRLQQQLHDWVAGGVRSCALEASSIGLAEHRLDGAAIAVAAFTNFSQDHLDYHGSMVAYWAAKRALFGWPGLRAAVVNVDDPRGPELAAELRARGLDLWTVSLRGQARLSARELQAAATGLRWKVCEGAQELPLSTGLIAAHDAANYMVVLACLRALGVPLAQALHTCAELPAVPGRLERLEHPGRPLAVVDFAHTPDALDKVLRALRPLARQRGGRLWCVFGCGGNRDAAKRPLMGAVAERLADELILTSDNPRDEEPMAILAQIATGLQHPAAARQVPDRAEAIRLALARAAAPCDVVLIAGRGHETQQEIAGQRLPFSDRQHAQAALQGRPCAVEVGR